MIAAAATALDNSICHYEENRQEKNASRAGDEKEWMLLTFDPIALKYINRRVDPSIQRKYTKIGESYNMCFKLVKSDSKLVRSILFAYGFLHCSAKNTNCNLLWTNTHLSTTTLRQLRPWQRMNHFPRSWMITRKDVLYENVGRAAIQYGYDWFNFIPDFFCTPLSEESKQKLHKCLLEIECSDGSGASPFIVKPVDGSFGRGIFFLEKAEQILLLDTDNEQQQNDRKLLISRYISRPYLINQLKWDLRIYVLVTSFYPLIAYVYNEGLARFAVHEYKDGNANLADVNQHLTNYSLNKSSQEFVRNTDCTHENEGHKWTLGALLRELETRDGVDTGLLMVRIEDVIIKTLLSVQPKVAAMCRKLNLHPKCCFELFGFDILIDEDLKPWLLEVNLSPSLTCDSPLDSLLKSHLYCNVLNIAQIPLICDKNGQNQCHWEMEEETTNRNEDEKDTRGNDEIQRQNSNESQQTTQNAISSNSSSSLHSNANLHSENGSDECSSMNEGRPPAAKQRRLSPPLPVVFGGKVRKMQAKFTQKITYSADRITPRYLERVKLLHEKLKSEESRRENFTRIFPRKTTWDMYRLILEDSGQERWDEALHSRMMRTNAEKEKQQELAIRDIRLAHEQLMDAKNFKHRKQLDPIVKDFVLAEALQSAECYKRKMYPGDLKPYPSALPKIRPNARRRTRSQCVAEEVRKKKMEQRKAAMEGGGEDEKNTPLTNGPLAEMNLNNIVERSSSDKDKLMQTEEYC